MPVRYYLKLVGYTSGWITGDSTDTEYLNWIDGPSWTIGTLQSSFVSAGGPGRISPSLLHFVTRDGKAAVRLHGAYTMGDYFELVLVSLHDGQPNLRIEGNNAFVESWSPSGRDDEGQFLDVFSLRFENFKSTTLLPPQHETVHAQHLPLIQASVAKTLQARGR
jgi:type VI protein secretion system component Hcp